MEDIRIGWHEYFMKIAEQVATRSTCNRKHIGAVIVRDKTILSTGYNGSLRGSPHCDDAGHDGPRSLRPHCSCRVECGCSGSEERYQY